MFALLAVLFVLKFLLLFKVYSPTQIWFCSKVIVLLVYIVAHQIVTETALTHVLRVMNYQLSGFQSIAITAYGSMGLRL